MVRTEPQVSAQRPGRGVVTVRREVRGRDRGAHRQITGYIHVPFLKPRRGIHILVVLLFQICLLNSLFGSS